MLERFRREVRLARRVTHPNVARIFDIGEHGGDRFLTMEFVDGESLAALLARERALPGRRAPSRWLAPSAPGWRPPTRPASSTATSSPTTC